MWIVTILLLLAGGALGASNIIIKSRPNAKELIDKLVPYQGLIGVLMLAWGLHDAYYVLRLIEGAISFWWLILLVAALTQLGLGFLLGYGLVMKYIVGDSPAATEKAERLRAKLSSYQGLRGVTAIILAVIYFFGAIR